MDALQEILGKLNLSEYDKVTINITHVIYTAPISVIEVPKPKDLAPKPVSKRMKKQLSRSIQVHAPLKGPEPLKSAPMANAFKPASRHV